ncbi:MAG TPA: alpha/beta hydrolase-fold protein [Fimbriimonadaceae bacterium]|nr:alpha/beta hydrolase-fold protein [Fimbriimonadaceae bacterium]
MLAFSIALVMNSLTPEEATFLESLRGLLKTEPARAQVLIRQKFKEADLKIGIPPYKEGLSVLFAIDPGPGSHTAKVVGDNLPETALHPVGNLLVHLTEFEPMHGTTVQYVLDGKSAGKTYNLEVYRPNPAVDPPPGGRKGEMRDMGEWKSKVFPGTTRKWFLYLPPNFEAGKEYPALFGTDAQWDKEWQANALENCAREKRIPPTVGIFIEPGQDRPGNYRNRSYEYARLSPDYTTFLLTEIIPEVEKVVKLSRDPSQRALVGVSSGGICGFTDCWERPDAFSTFISAVGSFDNIAHGESKRDGGHNYPFLVRLTDRKPIRAFLQGGIRDLDNQFGNWYLGNAQMAAALKFKGYDVQWHPGQGFHSSDHLRSIFDQALVWWNGLK